jgi:hypothetical protein
MFVLTPSPTALRSPLSPKGEREHILVLVFRSQQQAAEPQVIVDWIERNLDKSGHGPPLQGNAHELMSPCIER